MWGGAEWGGARVTSRKGHVGSGVGSGSGLGLVVVVVGGVVGVVVSAAALFGRLQPHEVLAHAAAVLPELRLVGVEREPE